MKEHCPDCGAWMAFVCHYWEAPHCHNCGGMFDGNGDWLKGQGVEREDGR